MCSGKTGSGKTATAVKIVYRMWLGGLDVWSNTPLFFTDFDNGQGGENIVKNPEYFSFIERMTYLIRSKIVSKLFKKEFGVRRRGTINFFDTIDETFHIKDAVILFDEGQTLFRNYDWEAVPRLFLYKIEQNRKHGLDLVTTAQRMRAVNINYRELIQHWNHFESILPEVLEKFLHIHLYRQKFIDEDYITDNNFNIKDHPEIKSRFRILGWWQAKRYDSYFDIGFEPLQHYKITIGREVTKLHLESGMTVKQAITGIGSLKKIYEL